MQIPGNMTAPRLKLDDGETLIKSAQGLRKKGIFGNRFGALHVTDKRLAFVKAVMQGIVGAALNAKGVKPMLAFERGSIKSAEKVAVKKQHALEVSDGTRTERFLIEEAEIDSVLQALR